MANIIPPFVARVTPAREKIAIPIMPGIFYWPPPTEAFFAKPLRDGLQLLARKCTPLDCRYFTNDGVANFLKK